MTNWYRSMYIQQFREEMTKVILDKDNEKMNNKQFLLDFIDISIIYLSKCGIYYYFNPFTRFFNDCLNNNEIKKEFEEKIDMEYFKNNFINTIKNILEKFYDKSNFIFMKRFDKDLLNEDKYKDILFNYSFLIFSFYNSKYGKNINMEFDMFNSYYSNFINKYSLNNLIGEFKFANQICIYKENRSYFEFIIYTFLEYLNSINNFEESKEICELLTNLITKNFNNIVYNNYVDDFEINFVKILTKFSKNSQNENLIKMNFILINNLKL